MLVQCHIEQKPTRPSTVEGLKWGSASSVYTEKPTRFSIVEKLRGGSDGLAHTENPVIIHLQLKNKREAVMAQATLRKFPFSYRWNTSMKAVMA